MEVTDEELVRTSQRLKKVLMFFFQRATDV